VASRALAGVAALTVAGAATAQEGGSGGGAPLQPLAEMEAAGGLDPADALQRCTALHYTLFRWALENDGTTSELVRHRGAVMDFARWATEAVAADRGLPVDAVRTETMAAMTALADRMEDLFDPGDAPPPEELIAEPLILSDLAVCRRLAG
jgi:hypothetical protein